ncbi:MAG: glycosyltransferase family 39 protein [Sphingobacteriales bacterium]|nr:glycosyltransferase family 39 protein [Sphingobacteriales bacterium]
MEPSKKLRRFIFILAAIKLIFPYLLQDSFYQPHRDEFLYLAEGNHLAWGYMEVPPLLSVFAWLTNLLGGHIFWIKLWPDLFSVFTFLLVANIIVSLGGKRFAILMGWLPFVIDGYLLLFFLFQPNFLDCFFWTLMAYGIIRFIQTGANKWLYVFGIAAGLGMMSKYSVAFYALSILAGLLLTSKRNIFLNKHFYFSALAGLLIFLPNLIWQYNHRFPVVTHMKELQEEQLQYNSSIGFIISQFMMNLPFVFTWIAGLLFVLFRKEGKPFRFIGWTYFVVIGLLIVLRGKDYYALGAYPVLFAFGAFYIESITEKLKWYRYALLIFGIALSLFALPLIMPLAKPIQLVKYYEKTGLNKTGAFVWEDHEHHPLTQDFADMIGWREMAQKASEVYYGLPKETRDKTMIYCRGYFSAGALNYYRNEFSLPEVYSDNASFLFWMPDKYNIKNLLLVGHRIPDKDDIVFQQFEKMTVKDSLSIPLFRETGMKFILFENGNDSLNTFIEKGIYKLKHQFIR